MPLLEREHELDALAGHVEAALTGSGALVLVCGESGAGKSTLVDAFLDRLREDGGAVRILTSACDPLSTPRPLGPLRDLAVGLGEDARTAIEGGEHAHQIFTAVYDDLASQPTVLVIDDLHWADQGTVDLLRFVLRRVSGTQSVVIGALRHDEIGRAHAMRGLLGDVARSPVAVSIELRPLTVTAIEALIGERAFDPEQIHAVTGGNPFFVTEMLDHQGTDLPPTVRDAVLARTAGLSVPAWDVLNLLAAAPESIPDRLLPALAVTVPTLRELDGAGLIRRGQRGIAFRHDLCRLAVMSVIPPGAEPALHARMIAVLEGSGTADAAVLVHHALGAGDAERVTRYAEQAAANAARSGAHRQAAHHYRTALEQGTDLFPNRRAELLERLADELYLLDELSDAITAVRRAMALRHDAGDVVGASVGHHALAVYAWYDADRPGSEAHAERVVAMLGHASAAAGPAAVTLGHGYAMQAYLALHAADLDRAGSLLVRAGDLATRTGDRDLQARVSIIAAILSVVASEEGGRPSLMSLLDRAPEHLDEIHSSGYSNLAYLDVEQRRLDDADDLLARSLPLTVEHDLPICHVWQLGARGRLALLRGDWDDAANDAEVVLAGNSAPLAQTWPLLVRGLLALRRTGRAASDLERAWQLAVRCAEAIRIIPAASALAEQAWVTGTPDDRIGEWVELVERSPEVGLEWARGELAVWLRRLGTNVTANGVAAPYRALLDGDPIAAASRFDEMHLPFDAALAWLDSGLPEHARRAVDVLDRLGADAVAARARRDLRAAGVAVVPSRRRTATRANPLGLTERQLEVLAALSDGSTNSELAARLFISEKTVDHHVSAILTKLGVSNRRDATRRARELGVIG